MTIRHGWPIPAHERVLARTIPSDTWFKGTPCWIFTGADNGHGYGSVHVGSRSDGTSRMRATHRVVFEALSGAINDGLHLDHLCRTRKCCNPAHLELVTPAENTLRAMPFRKPARGSVAKVECRHGHPFTDDNIYLYPDGRRDCRTCRRARVAACRARGAA